MIYHENEHGTLYCGDCLDIMKTLQDNSVDAVVTDPPYGLSFMGKKWDCAVPSVEIWAECLRVLKPGGYLLSFAGTRTQHRIACGIEDAGFEIRDMIAWVYGSGFPKSLNIGKQNNCEAYQGWGTALKPALEPITVARKPISEKNIAENMLKHGTGGINIEGCRVGSEEMPMQVRGKSDPRWHTCVEGGITPARQGRFPANLIHDGSDEVLECFPNDADRFFYCAKASKAERNAGCEGLPERPGGSNAKGYTQDIANGLDRNRPTTNHHPTVKPIALMEYLIKLVARKGYTVLDPFLGSGTTAIACVKQGRKYIGCEMDKDYCEIAARRIESELDQTTIDL